MLGQRALRCNRRARIVRAPSTHAAEIFPHAGTAAPLAAAPSRQRRAAPGGLPQAPLRPAEHHLGAVGGRGAVLRLDRRRAPAHRRAQLLHPLHAATPPQHLERGQYRTHARAARAAQRRVAPAGHEAFAARRTGRYSYERRPSRLPARYASLLRRDPAAQAFFARQTPSYRRAAIWWVVSAKRAETRAARALRLVALSRRQQLIPQFIRRPAAASRR
jgi:hypothetical protein